MNAREVGRLQVEYKTARAEWRRLAVEVADNAVTGHWGRVKDTLDQYEAARDAADKAGVALAEAQMDYLEDCVEHGAVAFERPSAGDPS